MILRNFSSPGSTEPGLVSTGSLLRECQKYMERKGINKTTFGRLATGDTNLINRMARTAPSSKTARRVREYMERNP
jgi:hypothetical protein